MKNNELTIVIPGVPVAKTRPRFSKFGTYDRQVPIKEMYRLSLLSQLPPNFQVINGPLSVDVVFELPIPKGTSKKKALLMEAQPHTKKPDIDNLYKMLDAFNGVLWMDDSQIWWLQMKKIYSKIPQTTISITYAKT